MFYPMRTSFMPIWKHRALSNPIQQSLKHTNLYSSNHIGLFNCEGITNISFFLNSTSSRIIFGHRPPTVKSLHHTIYGYQSLTVTNHPQYKPVLLGIYGPQTIHNCWLSTVFFWGQTYLLSLIHTKYKI